MELVILTGMSGAGKSIAVDFLEDLGYFCIDNLPPQLLSNLVRTFTEGQGGEGFGVRKAAFVIDVRSAEFFNGTIQALHELDDEHIPYRIIFLDCQDQVLISRYKQSRRNHPMGEKIGIVQALAEERARLVPLRNMATQVIDTSGLTPRQLRDYLYRQLGDGSGMDERLSVLVESFGFKYGIPADCDEVMDVRFIPNPYYDEKLRPFCGLDQEIREVVLAHPETQTFLAKTMDLLTFVLPYHLREGKVRFTIGVGCTGGRHRSVTLAEEVALRLKTAGYRVLVEHRDIDKDPRYKLSRQA
ncbi:MAG: RNase adapter RapZ [Oscillospiraceae bacterium]|nr:RNase adapter RapZ [Oscillospiraceae bacterium]MDD4367684.1 RNase adapter RapZ [Oscillospiraceae bacterium]